MKCPCEECICLAICRGKRSYLKLIGGCDIIQKYLVIEISSYYGGAHHSRTRVRKLSKALKRKFRIKKSYPYGEYIQ